MDFGGFLSQVGNNIADRVGTSTARGSSDYNSTRRNWGRAAKGYADRFAHVADFDNPETGERTATGRRFDELSNLYGSEVDRGAAQAGTQTAGSYSRRGMGDSGYAAGAQQDVMLKAAQARAQAREAARSAAVGETAGLLGQEAQIGLSPYAGLMSSATQRYTGNENRLDSFRYNQMQEEEKWFQDMGKYMMGNAMGGAGGGGGG